MKVRMTRNYMGHETNDVVDFVETTAVEFIRCGYAVRVDPNQPEQKAHDAPPRDKAVKRKATRRKRVNDGE